VTVTAHIPQIDLDQPLVKRAYEFARLAHGEQKYGEQPYIQHLFDVVSVLHEFGLDYDQELRAAAYLHDVCEDCGIQYGHILERFGPRVRALVYAVTNEPGKTRAERSEKTYPKIRKSSAAVALKLADRIANVRRSLNAGNTYMAAYRREYAAFREALYREDEFTAMCAQLDALFEFGKVAS
jgi:guanosine-3',5'-bis(diphosphate) 3'-pyrophosphohydrolase